MYRCSTATISNRRTIDELPYPYYKKWDKWISDSEVPVYIAIQYHSKFVWYCIGTATFLCFIIVSGDDENLTDSVASLEDENQSIVNAQYLPKWYSLFIFLACIYTPFCFVTSRNLLICSFKNCRCIYRMQLVIFTSHTSCSCYINSGDCDQAIFPLMIWTIKWMVRYGSTCDQELL